MADQQTKKKSNKSSTKNNATNTAKSNNNNFDNSNNLNTKNCNGTTKNSDGIKSSTVGSKKKKLAHMNGGQNQSQLKTSAAATSSSTNSSVSSSTSSTTSSSSSSLSAQAATITSSKPAPKVNKTAEMLETIPTTVINNNLDDVLKTVKQLDNTCDFSRCRTKTSLIGQDCSLCQQRFCMKHQLPEVHGCGGAIKKTERNEFLRPRPTLPISAALRRNEQKDAHTRLEQKLKEMSLARQKARK